MKRRILALLLALTLLLCLLPAQAAAAEVLPDEDYDGIPDVYDVAPEDNLFTGKMKSGHNGTTTVSFTMDYRCFFEDNTFYSPALASASVLGSALAYCVENYGDAYFVFDTPQTWAGGSVSKVDGPQMMELLGFEDVVDYELREDYNDDDICEVILGHRTVSYNGQTKVVLALWVRGTARDSQEEWSSNFHMGDLARFFEAYDSVEGKTPRQSNEDWTRKTNHRGFDVCATRILKYLGEYHSQYVQPVLDSTPEAALVYWITGHSRGASVGNLMASYLIDRGEKVFCYGFAAPYNTANTEASAERYDCIFNLVNANDFIPMLPIADWGFTRYGRTASVDASAYASEIKNRTGTDYSGKYLTASDMSTLLGKFVCITGENADRNNPGKILGWREVYVYHCGHEHPGETVGDYQASTFRAKSSGVFGIGSFTESEYNGYAERLRKYSYWKDGACETPAYCLQVLVELLVEIAKGNTLGGGWEYLTSNKLADKFDFNKQSLVNYATKLTEPHFMDTYSVIQSKLGEMADPGSLFVTLPGYAENGRPVHTHSYSYVAYAGQEPSCTEDGLGYRYCHCSQVNGDWYDDYQKNVPIPAPGHSWGDWTVTQPPACTSGGSKERHCLVCGETETEALAPVCPGGIFTDMPERGHWAHQAVDWAVSGEITAGTSETTFSPNAACTRAQVVTFLWRAAGKPESTIDLAFDDVPGGSWYAEAVRWAVERGITAGTGSGRFSPNQPCSRAEALCFLYRFAGAAAPEDMDNPFLDVPKDSWYHDAVLWALAEGITTGTAADSFSPNQIVSRAQVVTFLYRATQ